MKSYTVINWNNMEKEFKDLVWVTNGKTNKRIVRSQIDTYKKIGFQETILIPKERKMKPQAKNTKWDKMKSQALPKDLKGLSTNKHGGHQMQRLRGFKGSTYGPASDCRSLSREEIEALYGKQ